MIIGHQNQWNFLVKSLELGRLPHALLFSGQEQLGKKTLAIEFAKFINCQSKNSSKKPSTKTKFGAGLVSHRNEVFGAGPCQVCRNCQDIQKGIYPDFILIEPGIPGKEIQISQTRELIKKLSFRLYSAIFKIAVLDKAHLMTREAQNCFLKFLEEPKGRVLLILITEFPEMLLPTILSRVQKVRFFPVKSPEIENYLLRHGVLKDKAKIFSSLAFGKPGLAINFLLNSKKLENQKKLILDLIKITNSDLSFRFQYVKNFSNVPIDNLKEILDTWLRYFRSIFLWRLHLADSGGKDKTKPFNQYSLSKLRKIIKSIQTTNFLISTTNVNPKLAFENLLIEL